jgi:hypothetical protein
MSEEPTTTGTTADGNAEATGTTVDGNAEELAALKAEVEQLRKVKEQALAEKTNYERLKAQVANGPVAGTPPPANGDALRQAVSTLQYMANQGDVGAQLQVAIIENQQRLDHQNRENAELLEVPDTNRERVKALAKEYGVAPKVAALMLKGQEASDLEARLAEAEGRERKKTAQQTIATATVGVTASEVSKGIYKGSDYVTKLKSLQDSGDVAGARKLVSDRIAGTIKVLVGQ